MSPNVREELLRRFARVDDPEIEARRQEILQALLAASPQVRKELEDKGIEQGRLTTARDAVRRVLTRRQLGLTPEQDAQIEACTSLATLERWLEQAITAASAAEALA